MSEDDPRKAPAPPAKSLGQTAREARLAEALRANLKRRKAAARTGEGAPAPGAPASPKPEGQG